MMKLNHLNKAGLAWKQFTLGLAAGAALLAGSAQAGTWSQHAWTGDADSGVTGVQADYTMAVNTGSGNVAGASGAVVVNGITFQADATSGTNFSMASGTGNFTSTGRAAINLTGSSLTLGQNFVYNGNPRILTLTNLTVGQVYETSFYAFGWDAQSPNPYLRNVTFSSGSDSLLVDQNFYGQNNGIRVAYTFTAHATSQVLNLTPGPGGNGGTWHLSAVANRRVPSPPATITTFGLNVPGSSAVISPVVANAATIAWTVPFGSNLATLAPTYTLNDPAASCDQTSGSIPTPNFGSGPVNYTVTEGATVNTYTVTAVVGPASTARDILTFNANFPGTSTGIFNTGPDTGTIVIYLPQGSPAAIASTLAPSFTLSAGATANQTSGSKPTPNLSMSSPVNYKVTAQDGISIRDYAVVVQRTGWAQVPWTGDADSGIGGVQADYTVAVNMGTADTTAASVNGISFSAHTMSGPNFVLTGTSTNAGRAATNVTGDSDVLARNFTHGSNRVLTLSNLTPGTTYQTSFYTYGWDVNPGRTQRFDTDGDVFSGDGSAYGDGNGARIFYTFVAPPSGSKVLNVTQTGIGPFHISALGNRIAPAPTPPTDDTDGDDLADTWELEKTASGGGPGNLTDLTGLLAGSGPGAGTGDFDGDGLIDAQEYVLRFTYPAIDPLDADTDNDGLTDGAEIFPTAPRPASNPTLADTDGDGLNDLVEDNSGTYGGPGSPGTSAASADSDGDQYPDGYEVGQGGNPLNATVLPTVLPAGIVLGNITNEASTGISTAETYTHKISGGSAATVNGVALDVLDPATTPLNFEWNGNAGGKNLIGPGINNGTWDPVAGNVADEPGLRQMLGTFTYSGNGAAPGNKQHFTLSALEPGLTYELRLFIRKWDDGTVRPANLKFTNGPVVTNFYILEDRPGIVLGNGNNNTAYYISFTYVAQAATMTLETTVPNVSSGNGSFHMYGLTNREAGPPKPLDFTSIERKPNENTPAPDDYEMELIWDSRPGRSYKVEFSTDLQTWIELTDAHPSGGASTTYVDNVAASLPRAQYRVTDVTVVP
jgi:hypothetical protein